MNSHETKTKRKLINSIDNQIFEESYHFHHFHIIPHTSLSLLFLLVLFILLSVSNVSFPFPFHIVRYLHSYFPSLTSQSYYDYSSECGEV